MRAAAINLSRVTGHESALTLMNEEREILSIAATLTIEQRLANLEEVVAAQAKKIKELDYRCAP